MSTGILNYIYLNAIYSKIFFPGTDVHICSGDQYLRFVCCLQKQRTALTGLFLGNISKCDWFDIHWVPWKSRLLPWRLVCCVLVLCLCGVHRDRRGVYSVRKNEAWKTIDCWTSVKRIAFCMLLSILASLRQINNFDILWTKCKLDRNHRVNWEALFED